MKNRNPKSLTVIIPAFNEQDMVQTALDSVFYAVGSMLLDYEILVVNDGSSDATAAKVEDWMKQHPQANVQLIHNDRNRGLGYSIQAGFKAAKKDYVAWFPGDSSVTKESLLGMWSAVGQADMIIPYMENVLDRPPKRKFLSLTYTRILNFIFGLRLRYYNGLFIMPTSVVRSMAICGQGHEIFCELVVRTLKSGCTYKEVPFTHKVHTDAASKALSLRNMAQIIRVIFILMKDVYIVRKPLGR